MIDKTDAITSLRPNAEWSMDGDDVSNITWHTPDVEPLTETEIAAEMLRLEQERADADAARVSARESAMAKLSALGLNESEINAMMGGL